MEISKKMALTQNAIENMYNNQKTTTKPTVQVLTITKAVSNQRYPLVIQISDGIHMAPAMIPAESVTFFENNIARNTLVIIEKFSVMTYANAVVLIINECNVVIPQLQTGLTIGKPEPYLKNGPMNEVAEPPHDELAPPLETGFEPALFLR